MQFNDAHSLNLAKKNRSAFTLIELLMVIAIIVVLSAITFGIARGVQNAQSRSKAEFELAAISQALESYKAKYGDYPWIAQSSGNYPSTEGQVNSTMMLYALTGRAKLSQNNGSTEVTFVANSMNNQQVEAAPKFIDITKFDYAGTDDDPEVLLDPWGNPYIYLYKKEGQLSSWEKYGYHLYSMGPNGNLTSVESAIEQEIDQTSGIIDDEAGFRDVVDQHGMLFAE